MTQNYFGFNNYLFSLTSNTKEHTHTRIGNKDLKIYGGKYDIKNINDFYKKYNDHIFKNGNKEYITEKQIENGQILIDFDFRYDKDIRERQHTNEELDNIIELYVSELEEIFDISKNVSFHIFVLEKPNVNCLKEKTKDGIHIIIGIKMSNELQLYLREKVLKKIDNVLCDLPLQNSYESVLDLGISKGTTNWQLFGSCKPGNETYQLVKYYDLSINDEDEYDIEEYDLENPKKNFILKILPKISARNKNLVEFKVKKKVLEKIKLLKEKKNKKKKKKKNIKKKFKKKKKINFIKNIN